MKWIRDVELMRAVTGWLILASTGIFVIAMIAWGTVAVYKGWGLHPAVFQQFAAVIGLPCAAVASLCVVLLLRISSGEIEVEAWGLKFKGGAAPIVFWVICYLTIAVTIRMLWNFDVEPPLPRLN